MPATEQKAAHKLAPVQNQKKYIEYTQIGLRVEADTKECIQNFAEKYGKSMSEVILESIMERIQIDDLIEIEKGNVDYEDTLPTILWTSLSDTERLIEDFKKTPYKEQEYIDQLLKENKELNREIYAQEEFLDDAKEHIEYLETQLEHDRYFTTTLVKAVTGVFVEGRLLKEISEKYRMPVKRVWDTVSKQYYTNAYCLDAWKKYDSKLTLEFLKKLKGVQV